MWPVEYTSYPDFNPHSREGSDIGRKNNKKKLQQYFNPHSREGSDNLMFEVEKEREDFNPHSREGSDIFRLCDTYGTISISIHTPAKGVTLCGELYQRLVHISIHTPAKGVTAILPNFRLYIL